MTEVFKSEAAHTLPNLVWTVFVIGAMVVMSLLCGFMAYTQGISYVPSIAAAAVGVIFFFLARKSYEKINRYIHFPPNCQYVGKD